MPTHEIALRVQVSGPEQFSEIWQTFGLVSVGLGLRYPSSSLGSIALDIDPEEMNYTAGEPIFHDEDTLPKVAAALRESGLGEKDIRDAISAMQNFGILFRERVK